MICFIPSPSDGVSHAAKGMVRPSRSPKPSPTTPSWPRVTARSWPATSRGTCPTTSADRARSRSRTRASRPHEAAIYTIADGKTIADVGAFFSPTAPPGPPPFSAVSWHRVGVAGRAHHDGPRSRSREIRVHLLRARHRRQRGAALHPGHAQGGHRLLMGRRDLEFGSIPNLVRAAGERFGDREAVKELGADGVTFTYTELAAAARDAAGAFVAAGVEPGDRVAIWAPNLPEWVVALAGLQSAGGVVVPHQHPLQGRTRPPTSSSAPRHGCSSPSTASSATTTSRCSTAAALPALERIVVLRGSTPPTAPSRGTDFLAGGRRPSTRRRRSAHRPRSGPNRSPT